MEPQTEFFGSHLKMYLGKFFKYEVIKIYLFNLGKERCVNHRGYIYSSYNIVTMYTLHIGITSNHLFLKVSL
jgi:hypothetical protein